MKRSLDDAMKKLGAAESAFVGSMFLAPMVRGRGVMVKIAGVRCTLDVLPADFHGWGVFRANSVKQASLLRPATHAQRREYLKLFPSFVMIACVASEHMLLATPADLSDSRFSISGPAPIELCEGVDLFDIVTARFDGSQLWYDRHDPRADPAAAAYLRRELSAMSDPAGLDRPGLTKGQRIAYAVQYARRAKAILAEQNRQADVRLKAALAHAGAELRDFSDAGDEWRVAYTVDGRRHMSVIRKDDLTVRSAGICLSGQDENFDLTSLVGVLRDERGNLE